MEKKAIIKDTNEEHQIMGEYSVHFVTCSIEIESPLEEMDSHNFIFSHKDKNSKTKEGEYFNLSNGESYHIDDVIVGEENIREYRLNKIL